MSDDLPPTNSQDMQRSLSVWVKPLGTLFGWSVALIFFFYFFREVSSVMLGVLAATIVACTLSPLLARFPGRRAVAAAALGLLLIAAVGGLVLALSWPLAGPIKSEWNHWPEVQTKVNTFLDHTQTKLGFQERLTVQTLLEDFGTFLVGSGGQQLFSRSADVTLSILVWLAFIFVGSIFLMSEPADHLLAPALTLATPTARAALSRAMLELGPKLRRWVIGTLASMCIVFTASLLGYVMLGLELALPLALLAGLCEIVPTVGPAAACVIAILFAAATHGTGSVVGVLIVYGIVQSIEAYIILPLIMRGAVKIHPAVTLFTVVLWGKIFGVPGLMLAIPINLTLWTLAHQFIIRARAQHAARMLGVEESVEELDRV